MGKVLKRVTFELGGHAPVIVMNDADIERFVEAAVASKFRNAGQICISPTRFFVHDQIYDEVVGRFARRSSQLAVGDGMDLATDMGPPRARSTPAGHGGIDRRCVDPRR